MPFEKYPTLGHYYRKHFNCNDTFYALLEDNFNLNSNHWDGKEFGNDLMTIFMTKDSPISNMTWAVLADRGWYKIIFEETD